MQQNDRNVTVDDLLSLSFPLSDAVDLMKMGKTFYIPSTQPVCKQPVNFPVPLMQNMIFYFNIVTSVNFLTSVINAIIFAVCYRKRKDLLSGLLTVALETMTNKQETQALQFGDIDFTTDESVTQTNLSTENTYTYSTPWIFFIVLLSMLIIFVLYWIFLLIVKPFFRKSNACRYILPRYRFLGFLVPAMDIFLDIVHVSSGEQIRVFLMTIAAPACSLSFTRSVRISNF